MMTKLAAADANKNWMHIEGSFYLVRTQAGLKHVIKHFGGGQWPESEGYPSSSPAVVSLSIGYRGIEFIRVNAVHVNTLISVVKDE